MRSKWAIVAAVLLLAGAPPGFVPLGRTFPEGLPSVQGWERIDGEIEVENPRIRVQYEFYVNPLRQAAYEVIRYRVTPLHEGATGVVTEKVQWDRNGRDLRRFECRPPAAGAPREGRCAWHEMEKGSRTYVDEVNVIIWMYGLHRQVVLSRGDPQP